MLQWWALGSLALLLADLGADSDAAQLGGAVLAADGRRPSFTAETARLADMLARVRTRLGGDRTEAAMRHGAALRRPEVVACARQAIAAARQRSARG